ncbi:MAG: 2-oxoacid:acceptor oxidoreductase subunit alpha, partial [Thermoplasmata archaeon]
MITHGKYFLQGNVAAAEAAMLAGCVFYGGYPITPASDLMEYMAAHV